MYLGVILFGRLVRMVKSMTGFGRGECLADSRKFTVEIKSLNHRYLELSVRMPRVLNALEERLRARVSEVAGRGKVDVYVGFESFSAEDAAVRLNSPLCENYVRVYKEMIREYSLPDHVTLALLARVPDILSIDRSVESKETLEKLWAVLSQALEMAIQGFLEMKLREGAALKADLTEKIREISTKVATVAELAPGVAEDYARRLRLKVEDALCSVVPDEGRLLQEITVFADKSSIDEELTRLKSHLVQFADILERESSGKKLDFLIQEINRELNTIGSKSNDVRITRIIVDLKSELEKVREQVQNIE